MPTKMMPLLTGFRELKLYIPRKRTQVSAFNALKENLEENEILVQCDYSENYKNLAQDKILSAYFGHFCISIFTACGYYRSEGVLNKYPINIVSEASDHSRIAAITCFKNVIKYMMQKIDVTGIIWRSTMARGRWTVLDVSSKIKCTRR